VFPFLPSLSPYLSPPSNPFHFSKKAKNWGCPDTVDTNELTPMVSDVFGRINVLIIAGVSCLCILVKKLRSPVLLHVITTTKYMRAIEMFTRSSRMARKAK